MSEELKEALRSRVRVAKKPEPIVEAQASAAVDPMAAENGSASMAEASTPMQPEERPKTLSQIRDECILAMEARTRFVRDGDYDPSKDPVTDSQRVFQVDFLEHADVVRMNEVTSWTECLAQDPVYPYFAAWPGRLCTFPKDGLRRARLVFTPEGERLFDSINPYEEERVEEKFKEAIATRGDQLFRDEALLTTLKVAKKREPVIVSRIPYEKLVRGLPGVAEAVQKYPQSFENWPYHIVPIKAELLMWSTKGLKTPTAIALGSHIFEKKRNKNMTLTFNCNTNHNIVSAGGSAGFGPVLAANSSSHEMKIPGKAIERSCMEDTMGVLAAKFETVFGNPWFSRLAFENFVDLVSFNWTDSVTPRSAGILEIIGPNLDGTNVNRLTWWILAFAPYFQAALENWYDGKTDPRPTQDEKDAIGQKILGDANEDLTEFKLYITRASLFDLLLHFEKKLTMSEHAMNLQGGMRLLHQTQSSELQLRSLALEMARGVLRDELLTEVSTKLDFEYLVLDMGEDEKRRPPRPYAEQLGTVSGRACMCVHGDKHKPVKGAAEGKPEKAAAVAVAAKSEAAAAAASEGVVVAGGGKLHHQT